MQVVFEKSNMKRKKTVLQCAVVDGNDNRPGLELWTKHVDSKGLRGKGWSGWWENKIEWRILLSKTEWLTYEHYKLEHQISTNEGELFH